MELPPVVCPGCAATYRHPGRSGTTKCKACGAEIHVVVPQASPPAAPATAAPATAAPAAPAAPAAEGGIVTHGSPHARRHGTHHHAPRGRGGPSPALVWSSVGAFVVVVIIVIVAMSGSDDAPPAPPSGSQANQPAKESSGPSPWDGFDPDSSGSGTGQQPAGSGDGGQPETSGAGAAGPSGKSPDAPPKPRPVKKKPTIKKERYLGLAKLEPVAGCSAEDQSRLETLVRECLDDSYPAAANRAAFALRDEGKNAIPFLINAFVALDLETVDRRVLASGNRLNEILQDISRKRYSFDDRNEDETGTLNRLRCRYFWHLWWKREGATWQPPKEEDG